MATAFLAKVGEFFQEKWVKSPNENSKILLDPDLRKSARCKAPEGAATEVYLYTLKEWRLKGNTADGAFTKIRVAGAVPPARLRSNPEDRIWWVEVPYGGHSRQDDLWKAEISFK